jgi:DNA primase
MSLFEVLRDRVGLDQIVSANGSGKVRCVSPDHHDDDPSMHLYQDYAHCFGCGIHADVVDLWQLKHGFERPIEAALDLAREFDVQLPEFSEEGRRKAEQRRLDEDAQHTIAQGYHEGLKENTQVREWWQGRGFSPELQQRFLLGGGSGAAIIPF